MRRFGLRVSVALVCLALTVIVVALVWTRNTTPFSQAQALEKAQPADRALKYVVEIGPERECKSIGEFGIKSKLKLFARRTSYSDNRTEYTIYMGHLDENAIVREDAVIDFVNFAKQLEKQRKEILPQEPAKQVMVWWEGKQVSGKVLQFGYDPAKGVWMFGNSQLTEFVSTLEQVLKDVDALKLNKAKLPW